MSEHVQNIKNSPFVRGMVRVIDAGCRIERTGTVSHHQDNGHSAWDAIGNDWKKVGDDLRISIDRYRHEHAYAK